MWAARPSVDFERLGRRLDAARDAGLANLATIAAIEAAPHGLSVPQCLDYLSDNLHYNLGYDERQGLQLFHEYAWNLVSLHPTVISMLHSNIQNTSNRCPVIEKEIQKILNSVTEGHRLKRDDAIQLLESDSLASIGKAANAVTTNFTRSSSEPTTLTETLTTQTSARLFVISVLSTAVLKTPKDMYSTETSFSRKLKRLLRLEEIKSFFKEECIPHYNSNGTRNSFEILSFSTLK